MRGNADLFVGTMLFIALGVIIAGIVVFVLYLLTLSKALSRCHPRNRSMEPGMVWLMFVPFFNIVWQFFVVNRVAESLKREYRARGMRSQGDFGAGLGITTCILNIVGVLPIPILSAVISLAGLICFIIYWVKIAGFSSELARDGSPVAPGSGDDDYEDDFDDRPRRSRRDADEDEDDRPRRSRREEEYEDEDDRPRRRSSRDDREEEDDRPRRPRRDDRD